MALSYLSEKQCVHVNKALNAYLVVQADHVPHKKGLKSAAPRPHGMYVRNENSEAPRRPFPA